MSTGKQFSVIPARRRLFMTSLVLGRYEITVSFQQQRSSRRVQSLLPPFSRLGFVALLGVFGLDSRLAVVVASSDIRIFQWLLFAFLLCGGMSDIRI